jgi:hypothetical protein
MRTWNLLNCLVVHARQKVRSTVNGSTEDRDDKSTRRKPDTDRRVTEERKAESCEDEEKKGGGRGISVFLLIHMIKQFTTNSFRWPPSLCFSTYTCSILGSYNRRALGFFFSMTKNCSFFCLISSIFDVALLMSFWK